MKDKKTLEKIFKFYGVRETGPVSRMKPVPGEIKEGMEKITP
jgi:hypothetical protein